MFGAGTIGKMLYDRVKHEVTVVGFLDNNSILWNSEIDGIKVFGNKDALKELNYDEIIVASLSGMEIIKNDLLEIGIPIEKINCDYIKVQVEARLNFLKNYADIIAEKGYIDGYAVAEGGVLQGEFAKVINRFFPKNKLFLFDTFEGFDSRDLGFEKDNNFSVVKEKELALSNEELVLSKMPYVDNVEIRKGYFPDTLSGIEEYKYVFVNLDFDLYKPILAGLSYFYPRMEKGCVILIHDYYNPGFKGVKAAIDEYEKQEGISLNMIPIGDACSIAIIK